MKKSLYEILDIVKEHEIINIAELEYYLDEEQYYSNDFTDIVANNNELTCEIRKNYDNLIKSSNSESGIIINMKKI